MAAVTSGLDAVYPLLDNPINHVYPVVAVVLLGGLVCGYLAKLIRLPNITGNIFAGLMLGPIFGIVDTVGRTTAAQLEPITNLALSLIAISIGSHLQFKKLHNARQRIAVIVLLEIIIVPLIVFTGVFFTMQFGGYRAQTINLVALFLGVLSIATSPATVVHVTEELSAKGIFVKTLMAVVVLNNVANIAIFEVAKEYVFNPTSQQKLLKVVNLMVGSAALGVLMAVILIYLRRQVFGTQRITTYAFTVLLISYGIALETGLSPVVSNLSLGLVLANFSDRNQILDVFEDFEEVIFGLFFTLTGTHANFSHMGTVGIIAVIYLLCRIGGNVLSVYIAKDMIKLPSNVGKYLGLGLIPQAGITIGLTIDLASVDAASGAVNLIIPVVLTAVTFAELLGPVILRYVLGKTGEEGQALPRLISFIQEEYITLDVQSRDRIGVIQELVDFFYKTHTVKDFPKEKFLEAVMAREKLSSTGIGKGIAIPHAAIPDNDRIAGVMGIIREGINWEAIDDEPVYMIILVATTPNKQEQYLGVISTLARLFSRRTILDRELHEAQTPADVYEAIADEEFARLNQVLAEE